MWLNQSDLARITRWPGRTIRHKVRTGELRSKVTEDRCRNGKHARLFAASSLPADVQMKLAEHRLEQAHLPEQQMSIIPHVDSQVDKQLEIFDLPPIVAPGVWQTVPASQKEITQRRYEIIGPLINFRRKSNGHKPVVKLPDGREIRSLEEMSNYVAKQRGVSRATIWRWYGRFQEQGIPGLADRVRADKGISRFFEDHQLVAEFVQAKYLGERLSFRGVHEALLREWKDTGSAPPSYETVRTYLKEQIPAPFSIMAREGESAFHDRCAPYLITDYKSMVPNQEWVSDHMLHDVILRNDGYFSDHPRDAAIRVWLTAILDMRSRKCVAATWCSNPSSWSISTALRSGILSWGIPQVFYIDNGKDFKSIGKPAVDFNPETSGVLVRLGIHPRYCIPKHPQSKLIESWFGDSVHGRFDKKWKGFYCGGTSASRPEDCALAQKEHAKLVKLGKAQSSPLPTVEEFIELARVWIEDYNNRPHSGRGMKGKTPNEVFEELLPIEKRRRLEQGDFLAEFFWKREQRRVLEGGCIQTNRNRYEPADPQSAQWMFMQIEKDVSVACDPNNIGEAIVVDERNRVMARMQCQRLIARGPISSADVRAGMRRQRLVTKIVREFNHYVGSGYATELDYLRSRVPQRDPSLSLPSAPEIIQGRIAVGQTRHVEDIVEDFLKD